MWARAKQLYYEMDKVPTSSSESAPHSLWRGVIYVGPAYRTSFGVEVRRAHLAPSHRVIVPCPLAESTLTFLRSSSSSSSFSRPTIIHNRQARIPGRHTVASCHSSVSPRSAASTKRIQPTDNHRISSRPTTTEYPDERHPADRQPPNIQPTDNRRFHDRSDHTSPSSIDSPLKREHQASRIGLAAFSNGSRYVSGNDPGVNYL
jgi:hypothetical protein